MKKCIVILGSTGSIGRQTLDIVRDNPDEFTVVGLSGHRNGELFRKQCAQFKPRYALQTANSENPIKKLQELAQMPDAEYVINALAGSTGVFPSTAALQAGKKLVIANKESVVMAGQLLMSLAEKHDGQILPVDSEPSAIWQMLGENGQKSHSDIERIVLTASGGPFLNWPIEKLKHVTPAQAAAHPTWKMGQKVSIDSATLMNKAFEIIEAHFLFSIPSEKIDVTIHPQSIVHSFVEFSDGNTMAVCAQPDMRIPISYALFYPQRKKNTLPRLDFSKLQLTFTAPDYSIFKGPQLAYEVLAQGGNMPAVFCLADEFAVSEFIKGSIPFLRIYDVIEKALVKHKNDMLSLESLYELCTTFSGRKI